MLDHVKSCNLINLLGQRGLKYMILDLLIQMTRMAP